MLQRVLCAVCALCAVTISCGSGSDIRNQPLEGYVDLQGHRGARGLRPEDTIPAFEACIDYNMTTLELDTNVTADKQLIVVHDSYLNGVIAIDSEGKPAQKIAIADLTVEQLKTYDYGTLKNPDFPEQVPVPGTKLSTLPELFAHVDAYAAEKKVSRTLLYNAELKFDDERQITPEMLKEAAVIMVTDIEKAGLVRRVTVQSFQPDALVEVKKLNADIKTSALFSPGYFGGLKLTLGLSYNTDEIIAETQRVKADIISPHHVYVTPEFVQRCHNSNIKVIPWTVNDRAKMRELLEMGVDGIISDYPDRLYAEYQDWLGAGKN